LLVETLVPYCDLESPLSVREGNSQPKIKGPYWASMDVFDDLVFNPFKKAFLFDLL
jgi:hypothetical protein